eukprot:scaffold155587_cov24-Tisochrysis_lutea.AAC.1
MGSHATLIIASVTPLSQEGHHMPSDACCSLAADGCLGDGLSAQRGACTVKRRGAHVTCGTCAQEFDPESTGQVTLEAFLTCCARAGVSMPPGA